jgi:hypothetical protein
VGVFIEASLRLLDSAFIYGCIQKQIIDQEPREGELALLAIAFAVATLRIVA